MRSWFNKYSSPDGIKKSIKLDVLQFGPLCPRGFFSFSDCSTLPTVSSLILSLPKTNVFSLRLWFEGSGAKLLCPSFESPFPYSL